MTNPEPQWVSPRSSTSSYLGTLNYFDGSFLRLKNIEIGYSFGSKITKLLGLTSLKIMLSGNNLIFWSKLPEDREETVYNGGGTGTLYPNVKKINIGLRVGF